MISSIYIFGLKFCPKNDRQIFKRLEGIHNMYIQRSLFTDLVPRQLLELFQLNIS